MKQFVCTLLATTAVAFVPESSRVRRTALQNDLWGEPPQKEGQAGIEMSPALPFVPRPKLLDGSLAGDAGFEYVVLHLSQPF